MTPPVINKEAIPEDLRVRLLVAGAGVSGRAAAALLTRIGVDVVVADDSAENRQLVKDELGVATVSTSQAESDLEHFPVVVTSPGWRPQSPLLAAARSVGSQVIGDVELCYRLDRAGVFGPPRTWLVVTGTNGKTTTTGMLASIMQAASADTGLRAQACGNIGVAVSDALIDAHRVDVLVCELSSFQLYWTDQLVPDAGVLLNLAEDHIDWHGSFEAYAEAKAKVFTAPVAVAGVDNPVVRDLAARTGRDDIMGFTLATPAVGQVGVEHDRIVFNDGSTMLELADATGIEPAGMAGLLDACAASAVAVAQEVEPRRISEGLAHYTVGAHRGAVVHTARGISWVDNSKATNPHAADSALTGAGADGTVVWIAGGQLKGADVDDLILKHSHLFRAVALLGVDREIVRKALKTNAPDIPVFVTDSTDPGEAMEECVAYAAQVAQPGDTVILAPAAASLDMYSGMSQRGEMFAAAAATYGN